MAVATLDELFRLPALDDFPGPFARRARQVAVELRDRWEKTVRRAAEGRTVPDLHAARDDYRALLDGHRLLVEQYQAVAGEHGRVFGANPEWAADLAAAAELRGLYDELFPRWQTLDDLFQLLIEKLAIPPEKVAAYAAKHPPPQSFWDEEIDPFAD